jgi:hypothetical protein
MSIMCINAYICISVTAASINPPPRPPLPATSRESNPQIPEEEIKWIPNIPDPTQPNLKQTPQKKIKKN